MDLQIEYEFSLPRGFLDASGEIHQQGRMRLATASDEIESLLDPRVQARPAYLPVVLISRVLTCLGDLPSVTPAVVEGMFAADLAYLEDLYQRLNAHRAITVEAVCPFCSRSFHLQVAPLDGDRN
jgi:hypothetical protein